MDHEDLSTGLFWATSLIDHLEFDWTGPQTLQLLVEHSEGKTDICGVFQLWNLDNVSSMLRMAGQDLVLLIRDRLLQAQRTESRQRAEMEEDIARYLTKEERILMKLR